MTEARPTEADIFAHFHDVRIDRDNIAHYRGLMEGRLLINRCDDCGRWIYPHRPLCPDCLSWTVTPTEVGGRARLHMWTLIHQSRDPDNPLVEPIVAAAVELAEQPGLRYLSRIVGCPLPALRHDMALRLTWVEEEGRRWPAFEPAARAEGGAAHG
ncbi:MAG: zinc ribbon domain-containing protein [Sphingobium sp.]